MSWLKYRVDEECDGWSVERVLREKLAVSGRMLQRLTRIRGVRVNGSPSFLGRKVRPRDRVAIKVKPRARKTAPPSTERGPAIPLTIIWRDASFIAIDKPAGMPCHPGGRARGTSVVERLPEQLDLSGVHLVHRLDRWTSGVLLVATSGYAHQLADRLLRTHAIQRSYLALVAGRVDAAIRSIDAPIARDPGHRTRRRVDPQGASAQTFLEILQQSASATRLRLQLASGRTHQLRVHLAHIGHPVLGDHLYGAPPAPRLALHAERLSFPHPRRARTIEIEAAPPAGFEALAGELGLA